MCKNIRIQEQKVSFLNIPGSHVELTPDIVIIDKQTNVLRLPLSIGLSGSENKAAFTVDVSLDFSAVPDGVEKFGSAECYLSDSNSGGRRISQVRVPARGKQQAFDLIVTRAAIEAHRGRPTAVTLKITRTSRYQIDDHNSSTLISINMSDLGSR